MGGGRVDLLAGVRVAEVSCSLRGAFAASCLSDLGASVTRVDIGQERQGVPPSCDRHKAVLRPRADELADVLAGMDIVIEDLDSPLVGEAVQRLAAPPVLVSVTGLGRDQKVPNPPDLLVQASSGVLWSTGGPGGAPPMPLPSGVGSTLAGVHAASAGLWCLWRGAAAGGGAGPRRADVSEADAVLAQTGTYRIFLRHYGGSWTERSRPAGRGIGSTLMLGEIVAASDGPIYLQIANQAQLVRLHGLLGPGFREQFPTYRDCLVARDGYREHLERFAIGRTKAELLELGQAEGLVAAPFLGFDDLGPGGLLPLIDVGPDEPAGALPLPWRVDHPAVAGGEARGGGGGPLKVLELGGNWSGPLVGLFLQALGAEVTRVESAAHPDTMRMLPPPRVEGRKVEGATRHNNPYFAQLNAGKKSVTADLSTPEGRAVMLDLVDDADVVVENMAPGALDRLGLGYAVLSARNPALCVLSLPSLHPDDPFPSLRGYAPVFTGMGGLEALTVAPGGERATGMLETGWGDPNGGTVGLLGLLAALVLRARTGVGRHVVCSQVKAVTWQLERAFAEHQSIRRGERPAEGPEWHSVLPVDGGGRWVVAAGDRAQAAAAGLAADLGTPGRLAEWSRPRAQGDVEQLLQSAGLSTAPVVSVEDAARSDRALGRGVVEQVTDPLLGCLSRFHVPWLLDGAAPRCDGPAPALGEANGAVSERPSPDGRRKEVQL